MKKFLALALCALLLAGCSDAHANLKNPKEAVFSAGGTTVTKGEVYKLMMAQDAAYDVINYTKKYIVDKEIPVTDEMRATAQATLDSYRVMFGDTLQSYLSQYGFKDEQDYLENGLILSARFEKLTTHYVNERFEDLKGTYAPKKVRLMQFTDRETAQKALDEVKAGANYEETAKKYSSKTTGAEEIATTKSTYAANVLSYLTTVSSPTLSEIIADDSDANFYLIQIIDTDASKFQDQAVEAIASISAMASEASTYYFKKYNFHIYDKQIFDQFTNNYSEYLVQKK